MSTCVTVVASGVNHELLVSYDGSHPPLELFDTWAGLGWATPTPALPPRSAIDWGTPDSETGRAYSIRPWDATGVATLPQHSSDAAKRLAGAVEAARRLDYEVIDGGPTTASSTQLEPEPRDSADAPDLAGQVHISAVLLAHVAPSLIAGARSRGATVEAHETSISRTVRYRGSTTVTETPAVEVEIDITEREVAAVVSALTPHATSAPRVERGG